MDIQKIEQIITALEDSSAHELSVRRGDFVVSVTKGNNAPSAKKSAVKPAKKTASDAATASTTPEDSKSTIIAPMVGIFHVIDGVGSVGSKIDKGQVVGAIESMKLLNDVVSDVSGVIVEILVDDDTPVEYGQPLYVVEPE